jgi:hypothetical protein
MDLDGTSSPREQAKGRSVRPMAETPEARWQRLERQAARDRKRLADGFCPSPIAAYG